jgi:N-acetyl sugar amidotransferase
MDTTDPDIQFDGEGVCSHCRGYEAAERELSRQCGGPRELDRLVTNIREAGKNKEYDCVLGVSGGVDSSYAAHLAAKLGLRPLAVHLDNGWNTNLAVTNIEKILESLGIELHTHVLDWEEFRDLQVAFLKASVIDVEMVTDHAITALLYRTAKQKKIRYIISGNNFRTETVMPKAWKHRKSDLRNILAIHRLFGTQPLRTYPTASTLRIEFYKRLEGITVVPILNYVDYVKKDAISTLSKELGWNAYGGKHYESLFTRFYQAHILPCKFGVDKRKAHLSTLICSGQMSREEALAEINKPLYDREALAEHKHYVAKKLQVREEFLDDYLSSPGKSHYHYPSDEGFVRLMDAARRVRDRFRRRQEGQEVRSLEGVGERRTSRLVAMNGE